MPCISAALPAEDKVLLWPDVPGLSDPGGMGTLVDKRGKEMIQGVNTPYIQVMTAPESNQPTAAILHVPGGGYKRVVRKRPMRQ